MAGTILTMTLTLLVQNPTTQREARETKDQQGRFMMINTCTCTEKESTSKLWKPMRTTNSPRRERSRELRTALITGILIKGKWKSKGN